MTTDDLLQSAARLGLKLEPRGNKLAVIPADRVPPEFADLLRQHKGQLLQLLTSLPSHSWQAIPPDDLPLNSVEPHPTPNNRERIIGYLLRQGCNRSGTLTAWLMWRECAYFDGPGRHWDCASHAYAAARDAACWQLNRRESEVLELLAAFEITGRRHA